MRNRTRAFNKPFGADRSTKFSRYGAASQSRNAAMVDSDEDNNPPMFGQERLGNRGITRSKSPIRPMMGRHIDDDDDDDFARSPIRK